MTTSAAQKPPTCPVCHAAGLVSMDMPLDCYNADTTPRYRILRASWSTCGHCGASWFPSGLEGHPSEPIPQTQVSTTKDPWC